MPCCCVRILRPGITKSVTTEDLTSQGFLDWLLKCLHAQSKRMFFVRKIRRTIKKSIFVTDEQSPIENDFNEGKTKKTKQTIEMYAKKILMNKPTVAQ